MSLLLFPGALYFRSFGDKICPVESSLEAVTLERMAFRNCNLLVFYHSGKKPDFGWSGSLLKSPWVRSVPNLRYNFVSGEYWQCWYSVWLPRQSLGITKKPAFYGEIQLKSEPETFLIIPCIENLMTLNRNLLEGRPSAALYVSQIILTINEQTLIEHPRSNLYDC